MLASPLRASAVKLKGELGAPLGAGSASIARCAKAPGQLGSWQDRNLQMTIPHAIAKLHDTGIIGNFKRLDPQCAEAAASSQYTGRFPFVDTDLYKTLEGVAYEAARLSEHSATCRACDQSDAHQKKKALLAFVEEAVNAILRAQQPDGYVGTYLSGPDAPHPQWSKPAVDHELYNLGHLIQAAIAVNRQLSDDRLLRCVERFADLVNDKFGSTSGSSFTDGHPGVEMALVELARETGRREFVDLAAVLIERRGRGYFAGSAFGLEYFQDRVPFAEVQSASGHAVRFCYLAAGATDVAIEQNDTAELQRLHRLWNEMVAQKSYISGGVGSRHAGEDFGDAYELSSERAYAETCAAIAVMQWGWRLLSATGDARIADHLERVLFNAFAVGISEAGTEFFYDNPLQRRDDSTASGRREWFSCACCPPNVVRWAAQFQDHLGFADESSLTLAIATPVRMISPALDVRVETEAPWEGKVRVVIERAARRTSTLRLRIPGWAESPYASINGVQVTIPSRDDDGAGGPGRPNATAEWFALVREFAAGDVVELTWEQPPRLYVAHPANDAVAGSVAIVRGAVVYCVEQCDLDEYAGGERIDDVVLTAVDRETKHTAQAVDSAQPHALLVTGRAARPRYEDPYLPLEQMVFDHGRQLTFPAIPYFNWANRSAGAMRVWMRRDTLSS
ncbi:hypothetical protein U746_1965 [Mycolicibacterium mucogenicum 261Sha1.1M5]|nr:hypothetical protein U746_1965 [Mycolicibacterium mucogenicum 261Sha1.1M5]